MLGVNPLAKEQRILYIYIGQDEVIVASDSFGKLPILYTRLICFYYYCNYYYSNHFPSRTLHEQFMRSDQCYLFSNEKKHP